MRFAVVFFLFCISYLIFGVFLSSIDYKSQPRTQTSALYHDYSGVMNVHSDKSEGTGSVQDIIKAAADADLDFIFFNELNPIDQKQPEPIKYGNLRVFYGWELGYKNSNFLVSDEKTTEVLSSRSDISLFMSNALETSSEKLLVLAHPDKRGSEWVKPRPQNLTGIEVINLRHVWQHAWEEETGVFLLSIFFYPFNPELFFAEIFSRDSTSEKIWDKWNAETPTFGYLGTDATSRLKLYKEHHLKFPKYKTLFSLAKNHILLEEELKGYGDHKIISDALKKGQSYFSLDSLGDPKGFIFYAIGSGGRYSMGSSLQKENLKELVAHLPKHSEKMRAHLIKDGEIFKTFEKDFSLKDLSSGTYRVVVEINPTLPLIRSTRWIPWIFSNPIFIK